MTNEATKLEVNTFNSLVWKNSRLLPTACSGSKSLGCQARRAPQNFPHCRKLHAPRQTLGFKCRFPFLTTFSVSYVNFSEVEVSAPHFFGRATPDNGSTRTQERGIPARHTSNRAQDASKNFRWGGNFSSARRMQIAIQSL